MATGADIRRVALSLPGAQETISHGGPWYQIGTRAFVLFWGPEERWIFKLPKPLQELLFEARGDVFQPYRAGRMEWSYVAIEALSRREAARFVTEAWSTVAPKRVAKAYLATREDDEP